MRTRKVTKLVKRMERITLTCSSCPEEIEVDEGTVAVMCWRCAQKKVEPPIFKQPTVVDGPKKPKGYHLMAVYVDPEGNVFHKGVEQPKLKGTLPVTPIKAKKTKAQKELEAEKREAKLVKFHKKKQRIKDAANEKSLDANKISERKDEPISSS